MTRFFISKTYFIRTSILVLAVFLTHSCQRDYHQSYKDFDEYNTATLRQKSWFPNLISENCYDIKVLHYIDETDITNYAFGVFSYNDSQKMASALADTVYKKTSVETLHDCLDRIPPSGIPHWFIKGDRIMSSGIYINERFFVIENKQDKQIYFVYNGSNRIYNTSDNKASEKVLKKDNNIIWSNALSQCRSSNDY